MKTRIDSSEHPNRGIAPENIARLLTRATLQLDDSTAASLRHARNNALERQSRGKPVLALTTGHGIGWLMPHSTQQWVAMAILLIAIFFGGVKYWQHQHENDLSRLDFAILIDDLPLEVFVD